MFKHQEIFICFLRCIKCLKTHICWRKHHAIYHVLKEKKKLKSRLYFKRCFVFFWFVSWLQTAIHLLTWKWAQKRNIYCSSEKGRLVCFHGDCNSSHRQQRALNITKHRWKDDLKIASAARCEALCRLRRLLRWQVFFTCAVRPAVSQALDFVFKKKEKQIHAYQEHSWGWS